MTAGPGAAAPCFVVISGCSGGGKSTLLEELRRRGHAVVEEPGRRIVREELASGGVALPWVDPEAFLRRAITMAEADMEAAAAASPLSNWTFFDRGLIDAALALESVTGSPTRSGLEAGGRFHGTVFLAPPWPEIFVQDRERRHALAEALPEFERLRVAFPALGYRTLLLPKTSVARRADFVLQALAAATGPSA